MSDPVLQKVVMDAIMALPPWSAMTFQPQMFTVERSYKVGADAATVSAFLAEMHFDPETDTLEVQRFAGNDLKIVVRSNLHAYPLLNIRMPS